MTELGRSCLYKSDLGNAVCRRYQEENVVCPFNLRTGLFTTSAIDNIDHNPCSTTAQDSFNGTRISMFQHTTTEVPGNSQGCVTVSQTTADTKSVAELPASYTEVAPAALLNKTTPVPEKRSQLRGDEIIINHAMAREVSRLESMHSTITTQANLEDKHVSWAAYHSNEDQQ